MVVISDTSPLTALLLAGRELLVKQMCDRAVIPPAVEKELLRAQAGTWLYQAQNPLRFQRQSALRFHRLSCIFSA